MRPEKDPSISLAPQNDAKQHSGLVLSTLLLICTETDFIFTCKDQNFIQ